MGLIVHDSFQKSSTFYLTIIHFYFQAILRKGGDVLKPLFMLKIPQLQPTEDKQNKCYPSKSHRILRNFYGI